MSQPPPPQSSKRCKKCGFELDVPGCDDAEKRDAKHTAYCRGCAGYIEQEEEYQTHLKRGGRPYSAWLGKRRIG